MEPVGEAFDTDFHEAVALVPAPSEEQKGKVLDCVQTGYKLNEKSSAMQKWWLPNNKQV